jgi:hypothetical protein
MIETSVDTAKLDAALAKAQGEFPAAIKDSNNPAFKTKYADLSAIMKAIRPALTKHGLSLTQWPVHSEDNRVHMVTRIAHAGEWIRGTFSMPCDKQNAHGYGSIIMYLRRYCAGSCLGVITDLDDDGNAASARPATRQEPKPEPAKPAETLADAILRRFNEAETAAVYEELVQRARAKWSQLSTGDKARVSNAIEARNAFWAQSPALEAAE